MSFDTLLIIIVFRIRCLNPFGTGQCLSTKLSSVNAVALSQSLWNRAVSFDVYPIASKTNAGVVSIPLEQGSVFRPEMVVPPSLFKVSQSLWNRAVSFDCSGILKPCGTRLTRATSQLFPRLRELGLDLIKCCTSFNILFTYQAVENGRDFTRVFRFY